MFGNTQQLDDDVVGSDLVVLVDEEGAVGVGEVGTGLFDLVLEPLQEPGFGGLVLERSNQSFAIYHILIAICLILINVVLRFCKHPVCVF